MLYYKLFVFCLFVNILKCYHYCIFFKQEAHKEKSEHLDVLLSARRCVLGSMPRIISSLASLWQAVTEVDEDSDDVCIWGNCKVVRSQILTFLSPISFHHGPIFLSAIAVAWRERKDNDNNKVTFLKFFFIVFKYSNSLIAVYITYSSYCQLPVTGSRC